MLNLIIWSAGIFLEGMLLVQALRAKLLLKYSAFYVYILCLFLSDGLLYPVYRLKPDAYDKWNVFAGYLILFLGCGVIVEIFKHALSAFAGVEKIARVLGTGLLIGIVGFAIVYQMVSPPVSHASALFVRLQRNFLVVQAILLIGLVQVISYYRISLGRNIKGMTLGFGQCVGATLIVLTLRAYIGAGFQTAWGYIQPASYLVSLVIWLVALWSYGPNPVPETRITPVADYDTLASRTRDMVGAASAQLMKTERL